MTALSGPFIVHATEGSDSVASGVGASSAITISMMISTSSTTTSSAMWTGTINVGDVVYFNASTGRKFNKVGQVNNNVGFQSITFDQFWGENISGNAYCGGKRATLGGLVDALDITNGFDCEVQLETDVTMNASTSCGTGRSIKIYSDQEQTQRKITTNQKSPLGGGDWDLTDLTFHSTYGADARLLRSEGNPIGRARLTAQRCIFGDVDNVNNFAYILNGLTAGTIGTGLNYITMRGCLIVNLTEGFGGYLTLDLHNCHIKNVPYINHPELGGSNNTTQMIATISGCFFENVARIDRSTNGGAIRLAGNIFDGLAGSIFIGEPAFSYSSSTPCSHFHNNLLTNCVHVSNNVEGAGNILYNTSTSIAGLFDSTTLASDPYVDRANGDYDFTSDATDLFTNSFSRVKQFGFNHSGGGGGGGGVVRVTMNGGMNG